MDVILIAIEGVFELMISIFWMSRSLFCAVKSAPAGTLAGVILAHWSLFSYHCPNFLLSEIFKMDGIDSKALARGAVALTLGYFLLWLVGPLLFEFSLLVLGLPLWFWCSCVAAPLLLCLAVAGWLRRHDD